MGGELAVKLVSFEVIAALRSGGDLDAQLADSPFEDDLRCIRQSFGGGEADDAFDGLVLEEVAGTFPL